jgi:hypothetical protein
MAFTTPSTWVAGAILTAAQLNQQLRDNMSYLYSPQMAKVRLTSDFGAPYVSTTAITWQADSAPGFDTGGMWASGNATKLIPTVAGVYVFTLSCQWTYTGTMSTSVARILLNSNVIGRQGVFAAQTTELDYSVSVVTKMNGTTDFITADLFYSGTPTFVTLKAVEATYLSGHYIGPTP